MSKKKILILFATKYGQTARIAAHIAERLTLENISADLLEIGHPPSRADLGNYSAVILGTPVYVGRHNSKMEKWAQANLETLRKIPTGFFTVSLNAADTRPEARIADRELLNSFWHKMGWSPPYLASFAGALHYREYNFVLRFLMKHISRKAGGPTDTSRDYTLTNWSVVDHFAQHFILLRHPFSDPQIQETL